MANVYLIEQEDTEQLFGEYLSTAVIIAESVGESHKILSAHLKEFSKATGESIEWYADRLSTMKIGNNAHLPNTCISPVVCLMIGFNQERIKLN